MAIKREFYMTRDDGVNLYRTYSDKGMMIQKVGTEEVYDEAVDVEGASFEYVETDEPIDSETDPTMATEVDYQNVLREMGVDV